MKRPEGVENGNFLVRAGDAEEYVRWKIDGVGAQSSLTNPSQRKVRSVFVSTFFLNNLSFFYIYLNTLHIQLFTNSYNSIVLTLIICAMTAAIHHCLFLRLRPGMP